MKKILILLLSVLFISGCSSQSEEVQDKRDSNSNLDPVAKIMEDMTIEEKIGQLLFVGIDGTSINENSKSLINDYHVGGIILFKKNIETEEQIRELVSSLEQENSSNKSSLFFGIDQEGGLVSRIPRELLDTPSAIELGKTEDASSAYDAASKIGTKLSELGFNVNFAPVLDIDSNPDNPVIGERAFGNDPEKVSEMGVAFMNGLSEKNVIPVGKHFPGHGDTSVDSHLGLPRVDHDLERLRSFELIPFKAAIDEGIDIIMVAHILFPELDSVPSTISKTVLQDLLREEMGFQNVIITDDLTMGAIVENYTVEEAVVKTINAGSDIALVCHEYENVVNSFNSLKRALDSGEISEKRIDESVYRVLSLKQKYNIVQ